MLKISCQYKVKAHFLFIGTKRRPASPHTLQATCALNETMIRLINLKRIMINAVNKMEVWPSAGAVQAELANHLKVLGERFSGIER